MMSGDDSGGADGSPLVVVRQVMVLTFLLIALFTAIVSRHGAAVHMWLESAWWLVAVILAVVLNVAGILQLLSTQDTPQNIVVIEIIEQVELVAYLLLAVAASFARVRGGRMLGFLRNAFSVGTILLVLLFSVSSLLDLLLSQRANPAAIIKLGAALTIAVIMAADLFIAHFHKLDASNFTQADTDAAARQPFLSPCKPAHTSDVAGFEEAAPIEPRFAAVGQDEEVVKTVGQLQEKRPAHGGGLFQTYQESGAV